MKKALKMFNTFILIFVVFFKTVSCGSYKAKNSTDNSSVNNKPDENNNNDENNSNDEKADIDRLMHKGFDGSKFNTKNTRQDASNFIIDEIKKWKKVVKNVEVIDTDKITYLNRGDNFFTVSFILDEQTLTYKTFVYNVLYLNNVEHRYDVPDDHSCWLWAVATPYLLNVRNNDEKFKARFQKLFGDEQLVQLAHMQDLLKKYDFESYMKEEEQNSKETWKNQMFFKDEIANKLVREIFRNRVVDFIEMLWHKYAFWIKDEHNVAKSEELYMNWWDKTVANEDLSNLIEVKKAYFFTDVGSTVAELNHYVEAKRKITGWGGGNADYFAICNMLDSDFQITVFIHNSKESPTNYMHILFDHKANTKNNNIKLLFLPPTREHYNFYFTE